MPVVLLPAAAATTDRLAYSLTKDRIRTLIQAFVSCRLDYCNSLCFGMTDTLFRRLQSIQNAAARLATGTIGVLIIFNQHCVVFIGLRFASELTSNWPLWSIKHCTANYRRTSLMIVNLSLTAVAASYVHLPQMQFCSSLPQRFWR